MKLSSPKTSFDSRLLAIEEHFRQRKQSAAIRELTLLNEEEFQANPHEQGLYLSLRADAGYHEGNYKKAIDFGLSATRLLAEFPLHRRYARALLILTKSYTGVGELKNAEMRARDALAAFRRASDIVGQVDALNELARIGYIRCDYHTAITHLEDALSLVNDNPRKMTQVTGNLGTLRIHVGDWGKAEENLNSALAGNIDLKFDSAEAVNKLSLGFLQMKQRHFSQARSHYEAAFQIIDRQCLKREKIIALKYSGELAFEKGDMFRAKTLLTNAYQQGILLAPDSALVSQAGRRLADVELAMDNSVDAMRHAQRALETSSRLGEKTEVALSQRVIAQVFVSRKDFEEGLTHIRMAVDTLREVDDPFELARTLLVYAQICIETETGEFRNIRAAFDEALKLFKRLKIDYWIAETDYQAGMFGCRQGDLSGGFRKLSRAEKAFETLGDSARMKAVNTFLKTLSQQAVALSISQENEYKIFGNIVSPTEFSNLKSSQMDEVLSVLLKKTGGDRAIIFCPDSSADQLDCSIDLSKHQQKKFCEQFRTMLNEEISTSHPTLNLDCRRDPFINELLADIPDLVTTVIVVPFKMSDGTMSYLYLDRITTDSSLKPFSQNDLNFAVGYSDLIAFKWTEIQKDKLQEDNRRLQDQLQKETAFPNIISQSHDMIQVLSQVRQVINANISITIEGETGTGKDLLARAIHYNSERREKRYITVNCAALPETLLESELFGYKRGAFTGADRDKTGLFEEADGGTFFLDEIADMPLNVQAKILRVLENQEIVRLGDTKAHKVDVRVVSATNKDLKEQMDNGLFRRDLYYRLSALSFRLPPLRERREDIPLLIARFMADQSKVISADVMKLLVAYDWPGNVRELENEIKKLILLSGESQEITTDVISARLKPDGTATEQMNTPVAQPATDIEFSVTYSLYDYLADHERRFIVKALQEKQGVKKHAAAMLNIPESTLRLKIKQYGIDPAQFNHRV